MKKGFIVIWCLLLGSLLLSVPGIILRMSNERDNKAVIPVVDYNEFSKITGKAHVKLWDVLARLKEAKAETVAVKEVTLRNLDADGKAYVSTLADFLATAHNDNPALAIKVKELVGDKYNPQGYMIITSDKETSDFLKERLGRRFDASKVLSMDAGEQSIFYLNAEFMDLGYVYLGFDMKLLDTLKANGLKIMLRPGNVSNTDYSYLKEFDAIVKDYDIKYIMFDGPEITGFPDNINLMEDFIKKHDLILAITEAPTQIKYTEQKGLEELMPKIDYAINRTYIPYETDIFKMSKEDLFFKFLRGVVDRNIRFAYIRPLQNIKLKYSENVEDTITSIKDFTSFIEEKGYPLNTPLKKLSTKMPGRLHYLAVALSLTFAVILYVMYLFRPNKKIIMMLAMLGVTGSLVSVMLLAGRMDKVFTIFAAMIYPSFSSLLILRIVIKDKISLIRKIAEMVATVVGVNLLGAYTIVTTLSDIRYTMNLDIFRGVNIVFMTPLILFGVNYFFSFVKFGELKKAVIKLMNYNITFLWGIVAAFGAVVVYIYLARSGNGVVAPSEFELRLREVLEKLLLARPRFKEFIIGYPALLVMAYLYTRYKHNIILLFLGAAVTVGSVSTVNSFCHVFTEVAVSAQRTLNGLALGMAIGIAAIFVVKLILDNYLRIFKAMVKLLKSSEKMNIG